MKEAKVEEIIRRVLTEEKTAKIETETFHKLVKLTKECGRYYCPLIRERCVGEVCINYLPEWKSSNSDWDRMPRCSKYGMDVYMEAPPQSGQE